MSATSPAPLPQPDPSRSAASSSGRPTGPVRPALSVAGRAGAAPTSPAAPPPATRGRSDASRFPDDSRLRVWLVPRTEPPAGPLRTATPAHDRPPVLGSPQALSRTRPPGRGTGTRGAETPDSPLPDPTRLCCAVVQAAVEGLRGVRPLAQLTRWVTPEVYDRLALRARLVQDATAVPSPARAGIRRVRVFRIGDTAAEATVVVDDGPRVRAVAVRVEEHRGRWRATALEIG